MDKNHPIKKDIRCKDDVYTHLYTLIMNTDGTYGVLINQAKLNIPEDAEPEDWEKPELLQSRKKQSP